MTPETYLSVLNSQQREAVTHEGSPLLILAGAGSGKTRVITTKIAWLIAERGVESESILAVTFTNKAAREMAERARRLEPRSERSVLRTFHSFGAWFLRRNAALVGLDSNFTIYDDDDATTLLGKALPALTRQQVSAIVHWISRAKDYCYGPDDPLLAEIDPNPDFADAYRLYEKRLRETGNVDFGDLILLPVRVMNEHHEVRDRLRSRFSVVMVDEYQDSNVAQFELLRAITGPETYLCVVGDDDQSIYRFRGAEVRNILTFADTFPGTTVIRLEQNYRSKEPILDIASQVVAKNEGRLGKTLVAVRGTGRKPVLVFPGSQDDETAFCAELISNARKQGVPWQDWAILYRTNAQSLGFETEFLHRKIPYKVVGSLKFYEREEIKDALAFLSLVLNGRDEVAFHRIANKPARGLGEVSRNRIIDEYRRDVFDPDSVSTELGFDEHPDIISVAARLLETFSKKARSGLAEFIHVIETMRAMLEKESDNKTDAGRTTNAESKADVERQTGTGNAADTNAQPAANTGEPAATDANPAGAGSNAAINGKTAAGADSNAAVNDTTAAGNPAGAERSTAKKPKKGAVGLAVFVDKLIDASGLVAYHRGQDEVAGTQRVANMQELVNAASLYPLSREGLVEFLEHIELDRSMAEDDENPDSVTLITVHNTKGLEFPRVIITGLESGIFPRDDKSGDDLEEERRLMYVGCTRAMDELYLTSCSVRRLYGRTEFMEPSRFLYEIDRDSIEVLGNIPRTFAIGATSPAGVQSYGEEQNPGGATNFRGKYNPGGVTSSRGKLPGDPLAARWKPGRKLFHDDYGYGIISKAFTAGDELVIMVQFENGGEKRFLPKYQAHNLLLVEQD